MSPGAYLFAEIDLPLRPGSVVMVGLSHGPVTTAQGTRGGGGRKRMMEKCFLSPNERSVIVILREGREEGLRRTELISLPFFLKRNRHAHQKTSQEFSLPYCFITKNFATTQNLTEDIWSVF